ncbi:PspC domain-containing protein [Eupransor demetentiae]|uniref:Phage shock protein PspC (Stress-responsive transcriptional regulator) (PspC) n=1 Tax=Eupransor demetentiae TaxID=3109584 RepID=A0ABM9N549_9LACO|nr:Phage shock protein PspC (stress-responsive transcriptional regulator) (PspC) [Lactobacillaceae bacterium LMG 33000]
MSQKKFARSTSDRVLGGVLGGIADYFGWDVNIVRLAFIILTVFCHFNVMVYFLAWILIPDDQHIASDKNNHDSHADEVRDVTPDQED